MKTKFKTMKFFLGSSSPKGFYSKFESLIDPEDNWYCRILKGSPGCGKSHLLKRIADAGVKNNVFTEYIYCSADPDSLDAVIFPELKSCIVDGTAPHTLDPVYPGAVEHIINLGDFWDGALLKNSREGIIASNNANTALHATAKKYLAAYGAINSDTIEDVINKIDFEKVKSYAHDFIKKMFENVPEKSEIGVEYSRFISAISLDGILFYQENLENFENIYEIKDKYGIIGDLLLKFLRNSALSYGLKITTCFSPLTLNERIECILIPELSVALIVTGGFFELSEELASQEINTDIFYIDKKEPQENEFNKLTSQSLVKKASEIMKKAKEIHDDLENYYIKAMNFKAIDKVTEQIISEIF
ncbi:MAG: hypothetical protein NkDv07_0312 [Candidatus Improbicoccus devescovinae]|nr:MAG: hypothetical protein NkDv07_0312 [Candidatus Improbicoccus devescovinae]